MRRALVLSIAGTFYATAAACDRKWLLALAGGVLVAVCAARVWWELGRLGVLVRAGDRQAGEIRELRVELRRVGRCSCPVGFGQVVADDCPRHGSRQPAHVIVGAWPRA